MSYASAAWMRATVLTLGGLGAVTYASSALACGDFAMPQPAAYETPQAQGQLSSLFHQAAITTGTHTIVGMWSFKMTGNGATVDFGYVQWHSDGTEIENSGGRAPATENFCLGVWVQTGVGQYHLNHLALSYDTSGNMNARVNIKEDVVLDPSGLSYSGKFTLDVYDPTGTSLLQEVKGQVTAQRVLAN